ncbi:MAG: hydrogenase-3 subunit E [Sulfobacillus acidophilus]|uniref:Hydrogenase-3 subunit E n=1 Tax=Sulfobacillus acidophilus TaxID=53633 RepID=A0A2T2WMQ3_9FIRM|nr:MAG: hydrogenase-3 subunit E [Sulfobacillus acidophilus]
MPSSTTTVDSNRQRLSDYPQWLQVWQRAREGEYETVILSASDDMLSVVLMHRQTGAVYSLDWSRSFQQKPLGPPPSALGILETLSAEHELARQWPRWGWRSGRRPPVRGKGLFIYPLGPVRADVAESLLYQLTVMGDDIVHVQLENGFKRRHIRELAVSRTVSSAYSLVSVFTTTSNVHHSLAMAQAVEDAWEVDIGPGAAVTRTLVAELERAASHLGDLAAIAVSTGLTVAQMEFLHLKETILRINDQLFGHRYSRHTVIPGGINTELWPRQADLVQIRQIVTNVLTEVATIARDLENTTSFLDRLHGAGTVPAQAVAAIRPVGPVGRAAGLAMDVRQVHPYADYPHHNLHIPVLSSGDSYARFRIRVAELTVSLKLIHEILRNWDRDAIRVQSDKLTRFDESRPRRRTGIGLVEAPRGLLAYQIHFSPDTGRIAQLHVATPSQRNWAVYPVTMANGNILQDFPIVDASFSLSVAGWDG